MSHDPIGPPKSGNFICLKMLPVLALRAVLGAPTHFDQRQQQHVLGSDVSALGISSKAPGGLLAAMPNATGSSDSSGDSVAVSFSAAMSSFGDTYQLEQAAKAKATEDAAASAATLTQQLAAKDAATKQAELAAEAKASVGAAKTAALMKAAAAKNANTQSAAAIKKAGKQETTAATTAAKQETQAATTYAQASNNAVALRFEPKHCQGHHAKQRPTAPAKNPCRVERFLAMGRAPTS